MYWRIVRPRTSGVKVLVFNQEGKLLLTRIGYMHRLWVIPGGAIDARETPKAAAVREVFEETGIQLQRVRHVFSYYHEKQYKKDTIEYFEAFSDEVNFTIDDEEIIDIGWFALDDLPVNRTQRVDEAIERYESTCRAESDAVY